LSAALDHKVESEEWQKGWFFRGNRDTEFKKRDEEQKKHITSH
jgi:hypothetical protein